MMEPTGGCALPACRCFFITDKRAKPKVTDMQKEYKASVVLSLVMPSGKRVTFDELSGGNGSVFTTQDEALQKELEKHPWYGTKFKLRRTPSSQSTAKAAAEQTTAQPQEQKTQEVYISDPREAKEWLAEHFSDVTRTKMRTKEAIIETARLKGVVFVGL